MWWFGINLVYQKAGLKAKIQNDFQSKYSYYNSSSYTVGSYRSDLNLGFLWAQFPYVQWACALHHLFYTDKWFRVSWLAASLGTAHPYSTIPWCTGNEQCCSQDQLTLYLNRTEQVLTKCSLHDKNKALKYGLGLDSNTSFQFNKRPNLRWVNDQS